MLLSSSEGEGATCGTMRRQITFPQRKQCTYVFVFGKTAEQEAHLLIYGSSMRQD